MKQNDAIREHHRKRRTVRDMDPRTGEEAEHMIAPAPVEPEEELVTPEQLKR